MTTHAKRIRHDFRLLFGLGCVSLIGRLRVHVHHMHKSNKDPNQIFIRACTALVVVSVLCVLRTEFCADETHRFSRK